MTDIPRDRWQRPLIVPPGGGEPVPYVRVSTLAKTLDKSDGLITWKGRKAIEGVLRRPDLLTRTAGILANGDPDTDYAAKRAMNDVLEQACEAAGASRGSSAGTGFHSLTEAIDRGERPEFVTDGDQARLDCYREAMRPYEVLDIECFVVNDELRSAGTFDRLLRMPDGRVVVADLKSGKSEDQYPLATATQIAIYANGRRYDPETGERAVLHPDLDVSLGLLIHLPPSGGCRVIPLDLERGWHAAKIAAEVHHVVRRWKADDLTTQAVSA